MIFHPNKGIPETAAVYKCGQLFYLHAYGYVATEPIAKHANAGGCHSMLLSRMMSQNMQML